MSFRSVVRLKDQLGSCGGLKSACLGVQFGRTVVFSMILEEGVESVVMLSRLRDCCRFEMGMKVLVMRGHWMFTGGRLSG